ncbi:MAG: TerB family tellurite resistance protein [SAR324 cluster bacterium]|nr:TerB family tellurite resistance protein [SAR324 cluster bacterium]
MNQEEQFWYAKAVVAIIVADGRIDDAEIKYLRTIFDLFTKSSVQFEELEQYTQGTNKVKIEKITTIDTQKANDILKDCTSVAISDGEFHPKEEKIIRKIGTSMGIEASTIEHTIQWGRAQLAYIFAISI